MEKKESLTRRHIIETAAAMISAAGSENFRIVDLAERAHVGVPTVYYHFESRVQVIAEAQMTNYFALTTPLHEVLSRAESALTDGDQEAFWEAVHENVSRAWSSGQFDAKLGIVRLLLDIWADPKVRARFRSVLDIQFARWVSLINDAKSQGWLDASLDAETLVALFWAASVGQVITAGSAFIDIPGEAIADFYVRMARDWSRGQAPDRA
ncbi:MAG TPA: TetR/AcrR family transcriptional regulator [Acidimicrobiales bacterium]|nr:TetR/AcrR family transcriptional regulator [Acidimicrobiales bacterium]